MPSDRYFEKPTNLPNGHECSALAADFGDIKYGDGKGITAVCHASTQVAAQCGYAARHISITCPYLFGAHAPHSLHGRISPSFEAGSIVQLSSCCSHLHSGRPAGELEQQAALLLTPGYWCSILTACAHTTTRDGTGMPWIEGAPTLVNAESSKQCAEAYDA